MTWDDVVDILFDGLEKEIKALRCPDCNGKITANYNVDNNSLKISCKSCGYNSILNGCDSIPNCFRVE